MINLKIEILSEVLIKSGFDNNLEVIESMTNCVFDDRYLFELNNNKVIKFITWKEDWVDGKRYIFFNNLWIDPKFRNVSSLLSLKTRLRGMFKDVDIAIWFDRKKQKLIDRR